MTDQGVFDDVVAAAGVLRDLVDVGRVEAWGSSVLSVWREDDAADELDGELIEWLLCRGDDRALLVVLAVADALGLGDETVGATRDRLTDAPGWVHHIGTAAVTRAWQVADGLERSVGIGFVHGDGSELSLLGDLDDHGLHSLVVAPGPDELFAEAEDLVAPTRLDPVAAAEALVEGWHRTLASGQPLPESVLVNQSIGRRRLEVALGRRLDELREVRTGAVGDEVGDELDPDVRAELDAWALSTLTFALGPAVVAAGSAAVIADGLLDPFTPAGRAAYPAEEREAFAALEWADWLGAVIGVVRAGTGADLSSAALVDQVNRCPEVTSTVPKQDRPYYEWAWQHVVALWQRHGLADAERQLTDEGVIVLPQILVRAWTH